MTQGLLTFFTTYLIFPLIGLIMVGVAALVAKKNWLLLTNMKKLGTIAILFRKLVVGKFSV